jgi:UDP-N-acetylglucosamine acyltransferase
MALPPRVHPTAIVDARVKLADGVSVGAYAIISGDVSIGEGTTILEHCVIRGSTRIGRECRIGPAAYVGLEPQHLTFVADESNPTYLVIGDHVTLREAARINRASKPGIENATRIGDHCFVMGAGHVGHDCVVGPHVIVADSALLGGHCQVAERVFLGGGCAIHQFVRIGRLCIVAGNEQISHDVPPFGAARYGRLKGYNAIGCKRAGISREAIAGIRATYLRLRTHRNTRNALAAIVSEVSATKEVSEIVEFIRASRRGTLPAYRQRRQAEDDSAAE